MTQVSPLVETPIYFAHVRAASPGLAVQRLNCHPFPGGRHALEDRRDRGRVAEARQELVLMHNGGLGAYEDVIRRLREALDEEFYFGIRGTTDSQHAFAVIQDELGEAVLDPDADDLAAAVRDGLAYLETLKHEAGRAVETTWANFCPTDGESVVATRYASPDDASAQSLYVGEAGSFVADGEVRRDDWPRRGTRRR
jgi:predicted glutamine amidotransferase